MIVEKQCRVYQKGFYKIENSHHIYFHHQFKGKETGVCAYFSHLRKEKEIDSNLVLSMRKQLKLDKNSEAIDLLDCPINARTIMKF